MNDIEQCVNYLKENDLRLATAESCTAGMIISFLAEVEGSGQCLECGYVVYSPEAKIRQLQVNPETIAAFGLTSEAVAREMALGALFNSDASVAVANTGIAGPEPMDGLPPGTVAFAWAFSNEEQPRIFTEIKVFAGDRNEVRSAAARYALQNVAIHHQQLLAEPAR